MFPGIARVRELRARFDLNNGRVCAEPRFSNLNWYFTVGTTINKEEPGEWFNHGDVENEDVPRLMALLQDQELLILGWKDLGMDVRSDPYQGDGGNVKLVISNAGVVYDVRRDGPILDK